MKKTLKKIVTYLIAISAVFSFNAIPVLAAEPGLLQSATLYIDDTQPLTPANYTFTMTTASTTTDLQGVMMEFKTKPTDGAKPANGVWSAANRSANAFTGMGADASWTLDETTGGNDGVLFLNWGGAENTVPAGTVLTFTVDNITNPEISDLGCQRRTENPADANSSTGTCYVKISTFDTNVSATMMTADPIDTTTISYTVVEQVTVSAKVDPAFSFQVAGVAKSTTVNKDDDGAGHLTNGVTTTNDTTYNTLPFANLQPGSKRYLAQDITVNTNAMNGYTITMKMAQELTGVYGGKIDDFKGQNGDAAWNDPKAWFSPTADGTAVGDKDTGWLGAATNDKRVGGWPASNQGLWGPLGTVNVNVMDSPGPELNKVTRVSFALDVDVYQASDQYTGYLQYNCVPKY